MHMYDLFDSIADRDAAGTRRAPVWVLWCLFAPGLLFAICTVLVTVSEGSPKLHRAAWTAWVVAAGTVAAGVGIVLLASVIRLVKRRRRGAQSPFR
jgi:hypothetical protein